MKARHRTVRCFRTAGAFRLTGAFKRDGCERSRKSFRRNCSEGCKCMQVDSPFAMQLGGKGAQSIPPPPSCQNPEMEWERYVNERKKGRNGGGKRREKEEEEWSPTETSVCVWGGGRLLSTTCPQAAKPDRKGCLSDQEREGVAFSLASEKMGRDRGKEGWSMMHEAQKQCLEYPIRSSFPACSISFPPVPRSPASFWAQPKGVLEGSRRRGA